MGRRCHLWLDHTEALSLGLDVAEALFLRFDHLKALSLRFDVAEALF
jgi:hypothetical protein